MATAWTEAEEAELAALESEAQTWKTPAAPAWTDSDERELAALESEIGNQPVAQKPAWNQQDEEELRALESEVAPTSSSTMSESDEIRQKVLQGKMSKEAGLRYLTSMQQGRPESGIVDRAMAPIAAGVANAGDTAIQMANLAGKIVVQPVFDMAGDPTGTAQLDKNILAAEQRKQERMGIAREEGGATYGNLAPMVSENVAMIGPQLSVGVAMKAAGAATKAAITASSTLAGLQGAGATAGQRTAAGVDAGLDVSSAGDAAFAPSLASGVITGLVTKAFGGSGVEAALEGSAVKTYGQAMRNALGKQGVAEASEEMTDQVGQEALNWTVDGKIDPQQALENIALAGGLGWLLGAGVNTVTGLTQARDAVKQKAQQAKYSPPQEVQQTLSDMDAAQLATLAADPVLKSEFGNADLIDSEIQSRAAVLGVEQDARAVINEIDSRQTLPDTGDTPEQQAALEEINRNLWNKPNRAAVEPIIAQALEANAPETAKALAKISNENQTTPQQQGVAPSQAGQAPAAVAPVSQETTSEVPSEALTDAPTTPTGTTSAEAPIAPVEATAVAGDTQINPSAQPVSEVATVSESEAAAGVDFASALAEKQSLEEEANNASMARKDFPRGPTGLTPDEVKATPEWMAAKSRYEKAAAKLKAFNQSFLKKWAKEYRQHTQEKKAIQDAQQTDFLKQPVDQKPSAPQRVQLKTGPQTYQVLETIPQTESEKANGEQFFRVSNERTGKEQVVEAGDMKPVKSNPVPKSSVLGFAATDKVSAWIVDNAKRLFTAEGDLPTNVFNRWLQREGEVKAISRQIAYTSRDFYNALQKEFGISKSKRFAKGFEDVPKAFVQNINDALLGLVDISTLPASLRGPVQSMRDQIDALSQRMIDSGLIDEKLAAQVQDNLGTYMTRSYRVFDDPDWAKSIPVEIKNRARSFLFAELSASNPSATIEDANRLMESMLADWQGQAQKGQGGRLGAKDLSILIKRKDIVPEIRDLMGEYKSPVVNYARSISKMANLLGNQAFLENVRTIGMGRFLFEDGTQPQGHGTLIAAEESSAMAPLNGLRTTPEIARAFAEFNKSSASDNPFFRTYMIVTAFAKGAKTVGSLMTQARNLFGQTYFFGMNGHFDMRPVKEAVMSSGADIGLTDKTKWRDYNKKLLELGILDQSTKANELRDTLRDAGLNDIDADEFGNGRFVSNLRKVTFGAAQRAYQLSDDMGKVVGFENEKARQKRIHPGWTEQQAEQEAVARVRNTYPNYGMVPEWVKLWRRQPVFGPFMTFAYETFRTTFHALRYTATDLKSDNPAQRVEGAKRLAGQMLVLGGGYALSAISRALIGLDKDEEDDAKRFLPDWDKNSQLLFTGRDKDGKVGYVNLSYANPYSYLTDPISAFANGARSDEQIGKSMGAAFGELLSPFFGENILASAMLDIGRNKTATGRRLWSPQDSPDAIIGAIMQRIGEAVEPGTFSRLRKKIIPAFKGEVTPQGLALSPLQEIGSELTGFKKQTLDYRQALSSKSGRFNADLRDANEIFRTVAARRGTAQDADVQEAYARSETARFNAWRELYKDTVAARRRGVEDRELFSILSDRGVGRAVAEKIIRGEYAPYVPSTDAFKNRLTPLPELKSPFANKWLSDKEEPETEFRAPNKPTGASTLKRDFYK